MTLPTRMRPLALLPLLLACAAAPAQRHNGGSSPPTAPPVRPSSPQPPPIVPVSSGLGALQFIQVNYGVPAPQSLTRQLEADDDRTRAASLSAIGAPGQYLVRGHIPFPHSIALDFVPLGGSDELDAVLTVELDQHIVSAVLLPEDGNWHRVATVLYPTSYADPSTTPSTFVRMARSLQSPLRYRAIFHATSYGPNGSFTENEAQLRILGGRASITISFASNERLCDANHSHGCDLTHRWLQSDPADPTHRFTLVTASGHLNAHEAADPLNTAHSFQMAHLRSFACQPFQFADAAQRFEPTANSRPCSTPH